LQALIANNAPDAVLSLLHDPAAATAAHAAGVGAQLDIALGGGHPEYAQPVQAKVQVIALSDGNFTCTGPMFGGARAHLGPMAALQLVGTGIQVVVGSTRCQNLDQEFFRAVGIEPADHAIVCVKSAVHFMADYTRISDRVLFAVAPGANPCDLRQIPYTKVRAGVTLL
jgi:microcystin degradation protein MlrC